MMIEYNWNIINYINSERKNIIYNQLSRIYIQRRNILDITLKKNGNKKVLVVMMNPSYADKNQSDGTVNSIIDYLSQDNCYVSNEINIYNNQPRIIKDIKQICIRNLFSIYNPHSKNLYKNIEQIITQCSYEHLDDVIKSNILEVSKAIKDSDYIVLGWGDCPNNFDSMTFYHQAIRVIECIKNCEKDQLFIFHVRNKRAKARGIKSENILTNKKNPVHPCNGEIINLLRIDIDNIYRIIPRQL